MDILKLHPNVTMERVIEAVEDAQTSLGNPGFCITCGEDTSGVEPDAREYKCEVCGSNSVFGAEEILIQFG